MVNFLLTPNLRRNVHDRGYGSGSARAVYPDSLNPDTNPVFQVNTDPTKYGTVL
jgi:hypothetical protein